MDVLALILTCSVYPDDHLVRAMVELASQSNPNFVGDLVTLVTFDRATSPTESQKVVTELERRGGKPVLGLLGVPVAWASRYGKKGGDLFDGCTNLMVGSSVLQSHYEACSNTHSATPMSTASGPPMSHRRQRVAPPEAIRLCALQRYGADLGIDGYADAALKYFGRQRLLFAAAEPPATGTPAEPLCRCSEVPRAAPRSPVARAPRPRTPTPTADLPASRADRFVVSPGGAPILE
jgi:hypothetical protein